MNTSNGIKHTSPNAPGFVRVDTLVRGISVTRSGDFIELRFAEEQDAQLLAEGILDLLRDWKKA